MRPLLLLALLSSLAAAPAQGEVHPRTFYDGRGRPSQGASLETDVPTATPRWRLNISGALRRETWSPERGSFSDPFVLSGARRLFYIQGGELRAVDAETGQQVWAFEVGERAGLEVGKDHLIVVQQETVHTLDAQTGEARWQRSYRAPEGVETFSVHEGLLLVIVGERLIAYNFATGRERWRVRNLYGLTRDPHHTVLSVSGSVVFLELGYYSLTSSPDVFAFDRTTGKRLWKVGAHFSPLAVVGDKVYLPEDDYPTDQSYPGRLKVNTFGLRSGEPLGRRTHHLNGPSESVHNHSNPWDYNRVLVHDGVLYAEARRLYTGRPVNVVRFALDGQGTSGPDFIKPGATVEWLAGPYHDKLFVMERSSQRRQFLVGKLEGATAPVAFDSTYPIGANPISRLDLIGDGLYVGHTDGRFVAVDVGTGRAFFRFRTDARNLGPTHVIGDTLVVQAGAELLGFDLPRSARERLE